MGAVTDGQAMALQSLNVIDTFVGRGQLEGAAQLIVFWLPVKDDSDQSLQRYRRIVLKAVAVKAAPELWSLIEAELTKADRKRIDWDLLRNYGWPV